MKPADFPCPACGAQFVNGNCPNCSRQGSAGYFREAQEGLTQGIPDAKVVHVGNVTGVIPTRGVAPSVPVDGIQALLNAARGLEETGHPVNTVEAVMDETMIESAKGGLVATAGTYQLKSGESLSDPIPYDADPMEVDAAIQQAVIREKHRTGKACNCETPSDS